MSQGLNELLLGPTTLDCGMFCELLVWTAIRHLLGDTVFDARFDFGESGFTLTQSWNMENTGRGSVGGNNLYPFYDTVPVGEIDRRFSQTSTIHTRTFFNHDTYLMKHPGGEARLHNVVQIDDSYVVFDPAVPKNVLSYEELDGRLLQGYNIPRSVADVERLWIYSRWPQKVHPAFAPKTFGTLAMEARSYEDHVLTEGDWERSRAARTGDADAFRFRFNFRRLVDSVIQSEDNGLADAISRVKQQKQDLAQRGQFTASDRLTRLVREGRIFSNMDILHEMVDQGYVVAVLGKAILQFEMRECARG